MSPSEDRGDRASISILGDEEEGQRRERDIRGRNSYGGVGPNKGLPAIATAHDDYGKNSLRYAHLWGKVNTRKIRTQM